MHVVLKTIITLSAYLLRGRAHERGDDMDINEANVIKILTSKGYCGLYKIQCSQVEYLNKSAINKGVPLHEMVGVPYYDKCNLKCSEDCQHRLKLELVLRR